MPPSHHSDKLTAPLAWESHACPCDHVTCSLDGLDQGADGPTIVNQEEMKLSLALERGEAHREKDESYEVIARACVRECGPTMCVLLPEAQASHRRIEAGQNTRISLWVVG